MAASLGRVVGMMAQPIVAMPRYGITCVRSLMVTHANTHRRIIRLVPMRHISTRTCLTSRNAASRSRFGTAHSPSPTIKSFGFRCCYRHLRASAASARRRRRIRFSRVTHAPRAKSCRHRTCTRTPRKRAARNVAACRR